LQALRLHLSGLTHPGAADHLIRRIAQVLSVNTTTGTPRTFREPLVRRLTAQ
jgi:hypothetical protein